MEKNYSLPFTELTVGGRTYMLRLTALSAVRLEDRLGMSVYKALERADEIKVVTEILYALIESLRPEFQRSAVYEVFDDYMSEGGTLASLNGVIAEALRGSGFFTSASRERRSFSENSGEQP